MPKETHSIFHKFICNFLPHFCKNSFIVIWGKNEYYLFCCNIFLLHCTCLIKLYFFNKNFVNNVCIVEYSQNMCTLSIIEKINWFYQLKLFFSVMCLCITFICIFLSLLLYCRFLQVCNSKYYPSLPMQTMTLSVQM